MISGNSPRWLVLLLALASCSSPIGWGVLGYPATIVLNAERETLRTLDSTTVIDRAWGYFRSADDRRSVAVGSVTMNGYALPKLGGDTNYYEIEGPGPILPLTFDGSYHRWQVAGNAEVPSITDSMRTPASEMRITSPRIGDTIRRSTGLSIEWAKQSTPAPATSVTYVLTSESGRAMSGGFYPDSGKADLTDLFRISNLDPGLTELAVSRITMRDTLTPDKRRYSLRLISIDKIQVYLAD